MNINQLKTNFKKEATAGIASALVTNNDPEKDPASRAGDMWQGALASEGGAGVGALLGSLLGAPLAAKGINAIKPGAGSRALVPLTLAALLSGYIGGGVLGHKFSKNLAKKRDEKRAALLNKEASAVFSKGLAKVNKKIDLDKLFKYLQQAEAKTMKSIKGTIDDIANFAARNPKTVGTLGISGLLGTIHALNKEASAASKGIFNGGLLNKIIPKTFKDSAKETVADAIDFATRNPKTTGAIALSLLLSKLNDVRNNIANKHNNISSLKNNIF